MTGSIAVMQGVRTAIETADIVLADLTEPNPNAHYELGIADTLGKAVLLISQSAGDDLPYDVRHRRVLGYEYTPRGCKQLERAVRIQVSAILAQSSDPGL